MAFSLDTILQAYYDNADYDDPASVSTTKAAAFVIACRRILGLSPQRLQEQAGELEMPDRKHVKESMDEAKAFLRRRGWSAWNERLISFDDYRT
jgi:hypothetical protein